MDATDDRLARFPNIADKQRKTYDAMMLAMDEAIGKVRKKLVESGLEKNTLVIFISDNGGPTMKGTTVNGSSNAPFRGCKRTTLEGGIHVPFLISWPGVVKPGKYELPVIQLDLTSTAFAVAGVKVKPEWNLDGVNLLPYLNGKQTGAPHQALYWRLGEQMAIRVGDYKLVRYDTNADTNTGERNQPVSSPKLYKISEDLGETKDLANVMPEKMKELQTMWDAWNANLATPLWGLAPGDSDGAEPGLPRKRNQKKLVLSE
jgi:arylsulfatase A-like enzyme